MQEAFDTQPSRWRAFSLSHEILFRFSRDIDCGITISLFSLFLQDEFGSLPKLLKLPMQASYHHQKNCRSWCCTEYTSEPQGRKKPPFLVPSTQHWLVASTAPQLEAAYKASRILNLLVSRKTPHSVHSSCPFLHFLFSLYPFSSSLGSAAHRRNSLLQLSYSLLVWAPKADEVLLRAMLIARSLENGQDFQTVSRFTVQELQLGCSSTKQT